MDVSVAYNSRMAIKGKNLIRVLWLVNLSFLLAGLLPNALGHPFFYPKAIRPYIQWGGLFLYLLSAFFIIAFARRFSRADDRRSPRITAQISERLGSK